MICGKQMLQEVTISLHDVVMVFSGHSDMGGSETGVIFGGHWFFMMPSFYRHHKGTASKEILRQHVVRQQVVAECAEHLQEPNQWMKMFHCLCAL